MEADIKFNLIKTLASLGNMSSCDLGNFVDISKTVAPVARYQSTVQQAPEASDLYQFLSL